jgi:hypothetical protein
VNRVNKDKPAGSTFHPEWQFLPERGGIRAALILFLKHSGNLPRPRASAVTLAGSVLRSNGKAWVHENSVVVCICNIGNDRHFAG